MNDFDLTCWLWFAYGYQDAQRGPPARDAGLGVDFAQRWYFRGFVAGVCALQFGVALCPIIEERSEPCGP